MTSEDRNDTDNSAGAGSFGPGHGGPPVTAPLLQFDLRSEIDELQHGRQYEHGGPSGRTLLKEQDLRVVLMVLRSGGRMVEHSASGPCSIHVLQGAVRVHLAGSYAEFGSGCLVAMESAVRHDVEALEDSAFLLTIGRTKYEHVSDSHELRT